MEIGSLLLNELGVDDGRETVIPPRQRRRRRAFSPWWFAVVLVATLVSYRGLWTAGWVYEDANAVQANPATVGTAPISVDRARWLSALSHRLVYQVAGEQPRLHHLVNLGLHLGNGVLVYAIAGAFLTPIGALLAASLFLLHPLQSEAVAYVASRSELLAAFFALLGFWLSLHAKGWLEHVAVWACVALAVCAKESAAVIVPVMAIADAFRGRQLTYWRYGLLLIPAALMAVSVFRFDYLVQAEVSRLDYAATQATAIWRYLGVVLIPFGQSVDHDFDLVPWALRYLALVGMWALAIVPIFAAMSVQNADLPGRQRGQMWDGMPTLRICAFGLTWLLIALAPRFVMRIPEVVNEHQTLLPFIGVWLVVAALLEPVLTPQTT